jgi:phosphatidylglycerophosphate synthase
MEMRDMTDDGPGDRRPIPARGLAPTRAIAGWLDRKRVTPDAISLFGLAAGVGSGLCLALTQWMADAAALLWIAGACLVLLRGLSNMFDGMLAVEHGRATPQGIFYNEVPDRISDVALMAGAGYSLGGSPAAGWLAACLALLVAYVRIIGVQAGAPADFGGPMAKQQRMFSIAIVAVLLALTPAAWHFHWGPGGNWGPMAAWLWVVIAGSALTVALRLRRAMRAVSRTTSSG